MGLAEAKSIIEELFSKIEAKNEKQNRYAYLANNDYITTGKSNQRRSERVKVYKESKERKPISKQKDRGGSGGCLVALFLLIFMHQ